MKTKWSKIIEIRDKRKRMLCLVYHNKMNKKKKVCQKSSLHCSDVVQKASQIKRNLIWIEILISQGVAGKIKMKKIYDFNSILFKILKSWYKLF